MPVVLEFAMSLGAIVAAAAGVVELLYSLKLALALLLVVAYILYVRRTLQSSQLMLGGLFYLVFLASAVVAVT